MIGDIKAFFDLLFDKSRSFGFKTALFISLIGAVFIVDYFFNISYNIFISNKLSNLESVNNLKPIYKNDSIQFDRLLKIETELLNKRHYLDFISFHLSKIDFKSKNTDQQEDQIIKEKTIKKNTIRSRFWMIFSSNFFLILVFPIFLFLPLFGKEKITGSFILGWFASLILITGLIILITWIAYQIPIIFNNYTCNYILNALIHLLFAIIIVKSSKTTKN